VCHADIQDWHTTHGDDYWRRKPCGKDFRGGQGRREAAGVKLCAVRLT
jgi:hypothetical protein